MALFVDELLLFTVEPISFLVKSANLVYFLTYMVKCMGTIPRKGYISSIQIMVYNTKTKNLDLIVKINAHLYTNIPISFDEFLKWRYFQLLIISKNLIDRK